MRTLLALMAVSGLLAACHSKQDGIQPLSPQTTLEQQQAALTQKLDLNWQLDLPTFDDSNTDRQLPYSPLALPSRPRLLMADGLTYRYDSLGRLVEGYANYLNSDMVSTRQLYHYDKSGLQQVSFYWGSYPGTPLWLIRQATFFPNQGGRIDNYFDGTSAYQLRFDQSGHLIWSGALKDQNSPTEVTGYRRAIRDIDHNVRLLRSTLDKAYTTEYEYDDKPNPFYLLGGLPDFSSPNNVIKETKRDLAGNLLSVVEYSYEYRSDGYPIRKRVGTTVIEYVYAN